MKESFRPATNFNMDLAVNHSIFVLYGLLFALVFPVEAKADLSVGVDLKLSALGADDIDFADRQKSEAREEASHTTSRIGIGVNSFLPRLNKNMVGSFGFQMHTNYAGGGTSTCYVTCRFTDETAVHFYSVGPQLGFAYQFGKAFVDTQLYYRLIQVTKYREYTNIAHPDSAESVASVYKIRSSESPLGSERGLAIGLLIPSERWELRTGLEIGTIKFKVKGQQSLHQGKADADYILEDTPIEKDVTASLSGFYFSASLNLGIKQPKKMPTAR